MSDYVTFTPDEQHEPDAPSGDFTFECEEPEGAKCRWSCDCEEWLNVMLTALAAIDALREKKS